MGDVPGELHLSSGTGSGTEQTRRITGRSPWRLSLDRLRRDRVAMVTLTVIVLIVGIALAAPLVAHLVGHPPDAQYRDTGLTPEGLPRPPNSTFWLGTDDL